MYRFQSLLALCLVVVAMLALATSSVNPADKPGERPIPGLLRLKGHEKHVLALAFSPDGKVLASGAMDGMVCLWNPMTGQSIRKFQAHKEGVFSLAYSPDGKVLASSGAEPIIRLWDPATGQELRKLEGHKDKVASVAFSPDGKILASGSYDKTIRLWDAASGKEIRQLLAHTNRVTSIAFSPDGKQLVSGGVSNDPVKVRGGTFESGWADYARLWDVASGKHLRKFEAKGSTVAFCADGRTIAGAGLILEIKPGKEQPKSLSLHGVSIVNLVDSPSGESLRTINWRGETAAFSPSGSILATGHGGSMHSFDMGVMFGGGPEENKLINHRLGLWEMATGKEILLLADLDSPFSLRIAPLSSQVAAGTYDGKVFVWNLVTYASLPELRGKQLTDADCNRLWAELGSEESGQGYRAMWTLAASPEVARSLCKERIKAISEPSEQRVKQLLADLGAAQFEVRDAAAKSVIQIGPGIEPTVQEALQHAEQAEAKNQLETILREVRTSPPGIDHLRALRAIQLMELVGSPESRQVLEVMAGGSPFLLPTQQARQALHRLKQRPREP